MGESRKRSPVRLYPSSFHQGRGLASRDASSNWSLYRVEVWVEIARTAHTSMRTITKRARYCLDTVSIHEFRKLPRLYNKQSRSRFRQRLYHKINLWSPFRLHAKGFTNSVRRATGPLVVTCQPTCAVYLYATQCSDCSCLSTK